MRPQTSVAGGSAMEQQNGAFKPAIVKKSTMEVLNDTTASLSLRSRNIDEHLAKTAALSAATSDERDSASTASTTTAKVGRAVPFSGSSRPNVPEEEVITVKKQESKKPEHEGDESAAEGKQTAASSVPGDAKQAKSSLNHHQLHFDDLLDDVEEIPFLEEAKPEPKLVEKKMEAKKVEASDDDPIIEIENKHAAPKPSSSGGAHRASTSSNSTSLAPPDAKDNDHKSSNNNNYYEDKADDDDALLPTWRESSHEDIYDELRKLKRSSPRLDDDLGDPTSGSNSNSSHQIRREGVDEGEAKESTSSSSSSSSRDKSREKRKEKRRSKLDDEPKKIQAQVRKLLINSLNL